MARRPTVRTRRAGTEFTVRVARANRKAIKEIQNLYDRELQKTLGVPGGGVPSRPGEAPRKQTGIGRKNVRVRSNAKAGTVTVRINKPGFYLGLWENPGTPRRRPWLRVTVRRLNKAVTRIVRKHQKREARRGAKR